MLMLRHGAQHSPLQLGTLEPLINLIRTTECFEMAHYTKIRPGSESLGCTANHDKNMLPRDL